MAKTNVRCADISKVFLDLRVLKGLIITFEPGAIHIFDSVSLEHLKTNLVGAGVSPVMQISLDSRTDQLYLVRKLDQHMEMLMIKINFHDKKLVEPFNSL